MLWNTYGAVPVVIRRVLAALIVSLFAANAWGQSSPNFPTWPAKTPTAAEWNSYFASKVDVANGTLNNTTLNSPTINTPIINSPTLNNVIYGGSTTFSGGLTSTGTTTLSGGGSLSGIYTGSPVFSGAPVFNGGGVLNGTFSGPTYLSSAKVGLTPFTIGTLPALPTPGTVVAVSDCLNGSQTVGFGTGCPYYADNTGTWKPMPLVPTLTITVGGQGLYLGSSSNNQGNGDRLQLATSATPGISGQCAQFDSNLNIVPSGAGCGGGGGSGTVSSGTANQIGVYASSGTTISGLTTANNAVLVTNGSGVPSESTTLPTSITIPSPTVSNPAITGTGTYAALTGSAKLTTAASATGAAGLNLPQGTAPTSPANGDVWMTSAGLSYRANGATKGPLVGLTSFSASSPVSYNNGTGAFTCPTCATTTNGGALTATSPMAISAAGVISLGTTIGSAEFFADSSTTVHNDTYPLPMDSWPWATGTIDSVTYYTGGTSTPSFAISLQINGTNVTSCNGITVSSATRNTTTCTAANTITTGQHPTLVISGTSGSPSSALVQINYHHSNP